MIAGYELRRQVEAHLRALERERARGDLTKPHLEAIAAEEARFEAELARMVAAGEGDEYATTDKTLGTLTHVGSYADRVPGARPVHPR